MPGGYLCVWEFSVSGNASCLYKFPNPWWREFVTVFCFMLDSKSIKLEGTLEFIQSTLFISFFCIL
jgi:hypothetical protein